MVQQVGNSPAGVIEEIPNLAKRQRSRYWRPMYDRNGEFIEWAQTAPLPSDLVGRNHYLSKGFRLDNPNEVNAKEEQEKTDLKARIKELESQLNEKPDEVDEFVCDVCGKVCKNKVGLLGHKKSHK